MTEKFDVSTALLGELFQQAADDKAKIRFLEQELDGALRIISYLVARFGEPSQSDPKSRVVRGNAFEILDSPRMVVRWDDPITEDICFGVTVNEH